MIFMFNRTIRTAVSMAIVLSVFVLPLYFSPVVNAASTAYEAESQSYYSPTSDTIALSSNAAASGGQHVRLNADAVGDRIRFDNISVSTSGNYEIKLRSLTWTNFGKYTCSIETGGGQWHSFTPQIDMYAASSQVREVTFGTVYLEAGNRSITFEAAGKNSSSDGYTGSFDVITLTSTPMTYYISTQTDFNNYKNSTFAAGDRILFERGKSFSGQFAPQGSGTSASKIEINYYGTGPLPIINGDGVEGGAVYLYNQEYWNIRNIDVRNSAAANDKIRKGIYVVGENFGTIESILIEDCIVQNVDGNIVDRPTAKKSAGIFFEVKGSVTPTKFNNVKIWDNTIKNIDGVGITTSSTWNNAHGVIEGAGTWLGLTNVEVKNNYIENTAKDGVLIRNSASPMIQYNIVNNGNSVLNGAGFWPFNSEDAIFQYNEAYNMKLFGSQGDGAGFDADFACEGTIFQYNYSHGNEGGAFNIMRKYNKDLKIRYNISQNDSTFVMYGFALNELDNAQIYNNTFSTGPGINPIVIRNSPAINTSFWNNIFRVDGGTASWGAGTGSGVVFDYNLFYGGITPKGTNYITSDPKFVSAGSGGTNINMLDPNRLSGYKLQSTSPAINSGKSITGNGGKDFWGNTLYDGTPDMGAHEY